MNLKVVENEMKLTWSRDKVFYTKVIAKSILKTSSILYGALLSSLNGSTTYQLVTGVHRDEGQEAYKR